MSRRAEPVLASLILALVCSGAVTAQAPVSGSAELAFRSKYLFAGIPFSTGEVTQAHVQVAFGAITMHAFSTFDHDLSDVTEADIYGDYYAQVAPTVGMYVGGALYSFRIGDSLDPTFELYGGVVLGVPLSPTLHVAHDFDLGDGTHVMLSLSHGVPVGTSGATLTLAGDIDYNAGYWEQYWQVTGSDSGLSFADVSATLAIPLGAITISPMVLVQRGIHEDFPDEEVFGVAASFAF
jgi:hypothetical protein